MSIELHHLNTHGMMEQAGYALDVSCSHIDYARSLNHTKQQRIKRNGRKGK